MFYIFSLCVCVYVWLCMYKSDVCLCDKLHVIWWGIWLNSRILCSYLLHLIFEKVWEFSLCEPDTNMSLTKHPIPSYNPIPGGIRTHKGFQGCVGWQGQENRPPKLEVKWMRSCQIRFGICGALAGWSAITPTRDGNVLVWRSWPYLLLHLVLSGRYTYLAQVRVLGVGRGR